jgi:hypothetical protein
MQETNKHSDTEYIYEDKAIPLQSWTDLEGSRVLRLPYFYKISTFVKFVSFTHRPPLSPRRYPKHKFLSVSETTPEKSGIQHDDFPACSQCPRGSILWNLMWRNLVSQGLKVLSKKSRTGTASYTAVVVARSTGPNNLNCEFWVLLQSFAANSWKRAKTSPRTLARTGLAASL